MGTIVNGRNTALNQNTGTLPNVSGAMLQWFQPMIFEPVLKSVEGFLLDELGDPIAFRGVIQPLQNRDLMIKPEGERAWTWQMLHSDVSLQLNVDAVVRYLGIQYRVMARKDYSAYGYMTYDLIQDYTGSGPRTA